MPRRSSQGGVREALMAAVAAMSFFLAAGSTAYAADSTAIEDPHAGSSPTGAHGNADPHQTLGPDQHQEVARQHYAEGRVALALTTLTDAIARFPDHAGLLGSRAGHG